MKHFIVAFLCLVVITNSIKVDSDAAKRHSKHHSHSRKFLRTHNNTNSSNSTNGTFHGVKTIPFGPTANDTGSLNSVGEIVKDNVTLTQFPFTISRCDQIVLFPCAYINDVHDYRVRQPGFVALTAHYTNLYADKDGQKLIQQVLNSQISLLPQLIEGAEGCVKIGGDRGQKTMFICVDGRTNALNILEVFKQFSRCRLGDNLQPIPESQLKSIMKLCNVDKEKLMSAPGETINLQSGKLSNSHLLTPKVNQDELQNIIKNKRKKAKAPKFDFPSEKGNRWEKNRLEYFQPGPLLVPGDKPKPLLPPGMQPGLSPINNPGILPPQSP